ncbi:hypothetical protein Nepgr_018657 [Nepenthes gracilis]|uniref:HhH-GPD domain-containing protein n=1 Tax=Nepenthes gracilis TaxID=150966 RepID=A0AAD3XUJ0_NEPGR|nr:hypothetical protein Nepgr_018657 [Nepenthes gracilis]
MAKTRKRKQLHHLDNPSEPSSSKPPTAASIAEPFPSYLRPTPEECVAVRDHLLQLDGFPEEFSRYRKQRRLLEPNPSISLRESDRKRGESEDLGVDNVESAEKLSVLDGLVSTVLSQNTTDVNSKRAFASLKADFPTWEEVLAAEPKLIEDAIRCGGLAPTKAACIKNILSCLMEGTGILCLEYLRDLSIEGVKAELSSFKGIGPKTVACVLMFHLQQDDFPVDTHIFQIAKTLGWVPEEADTKKTYLHLNRRIPNKLKFDLNCLLFNHGKICRSCGLRKSKLGKKECRKKQQPCSLLNILLIESNQ